MSITVITRTAYGSWAEWRQTLQGAYRYQNQDCEGFEVRRPGLQKVAFQPKRKMGRKVVTRRTQGFGTDLSAQGKRWEYAYILLGVPQDYFYWKRLEEQAAAARKLIASGDLSPEALRTLKRNIADYETHRLSR